MSSKHAFLCIVAVLCAHASFGTVIDGSYRIVVPDKGTYGITRALNQAGRELAAALKEGAGLELKVTQACYYDGGNAVFIGANAAEKAGVCKRNRFTFH